MIKGTRYRIDAAGHPADGFTGRLEWFTAHKAWVLCNNTLYEVPAESLRDKNVLQNEMLDVVRRGEQLRTLHTELDEEIYGSRRDIQDQHKKQIRYNNAG